MMVMKQFLWLHLCENDVQQAVNINFCFIYHKLKLPKNLNLCMITLMY